MAHVSSGTQEDSSQNGCTDSETAINTALCDDIHSDLFLRSLIEKSAFQALCDGPLIKRQRYTVCPSEPKVQNEYLAMTFPRKLWKIVQSDQFKSIWWDENGTSIVINEEVFKKECLEKEAPFKIFGTKNMKSLVRQLNLYGFRKIRKNISRSASLAEFLEEEKKVSVLSKLQFYQNPNFKRRCPQLLVQIKRRIGIKKVSTSSSSVLDFKQKHFGAEVPVDNRKSIFISETSSESVFSHCSNLSMPLIVNPATSLIIAKTTAPVRGDVSPPPLTLCQTSEQKEMDEYISNQLTSVPGLSLSVYMQDPAHIVNFITTTTTSSTFQSQVISLQQRSQQGMVLPSTFIN
ncbi:heat shock transcription factor, Y-linked-like [Saccopteryx leptura]|uniref:heat shock transcription factor, Y-linked-like n=1 Tax=Saccopteryx leptura TaxID=249018 RepID=UPI00339CAD0D